MGRSRPALRSCDTEKKICSMTSYSVQWIRYRLSFLRRVILFPAKVRYFLLFKASKLALVPICFTFQRAPVFLSPRAQLPGNAAYRSPSFNAEIEWQNCNFQFPITLLGLLWNNFNFIVHTVFTRLGCIVDKIIILTIKFGLPEEKKGARLKPVHNTVATPSETTMHLQLTL
jgi:hypothetical protein